MKGAALAVFVLLAGAVLIGVSVEAPAVAGLAGAAWGLVWVCGVSIIEGRRS